MSDKVREFVRRVRENDEKGARNALRDALKQKVVERLNKTSEE